MNFVKCLSTSLIYVCAQGFAACQEPFSHSDDCIKVSFMIEADITYKNVSVCTLLCGGCALFKISKGKR